MPASAYPARAPPEEQTARLARCAVARSRGWRRPSPGARVPALPGASGHEDLDAFLAPAHPAALAPAWLGLRILSSRSIKIVGFRRKIAEKMTLATSRIPHITYVEEVDVTELEGLRATATRQAPERDPS